MCQVVLVLHANHSAQALGLSDLGRGDIAQANVANQPLLLQLGGSRHRARDGGDGTPGLQPETSGAETGVAAADNQD